MQIMTPSFFSSSKSLTFRNNKTTTNSDERLRTGSLEEREEMETLSEWMEVG